MIVQTQNLRSGLTMVQFSKKICVKLKLSSYLSVQTYVFGAQKNRLIETVLLSTNKIYVLVGK